MIKNLSSITVSILFLFTFIGCAKPRPESFYQGQGKDLLQISRYQSKTFEIKTGEVKHKVRSFSRAEEVFVDEEVSGINNFDIVELKSQVPLLDGVEFKGRKNHTYKIRYELTNNYLNIFKLGKKEDISYHELPYATKLANNYFSVPLIRYPISLIKVEKGLDSNEEKTNKLKEIPVSKIGDADHFKFDKSKGKLFKNAKKSDVYPFQFLGGDDYFAGEWYYAPTVVSSHVTQGDLNGFVLDIDFDYQTTSRVKFLPKQDSLKVVNLNVDSTLDTNDAQNLVEALEIPVKWLDYQKDTRDNKFSERKLGEGVSASRPWNERQFVDIEFIKTKSPIFKKSNGLLKNLKIYNDYFSFTLFYPDYKVAVKYAFKRVSKQEIDSPRTGKIYPAEDQKVFGFFKSKKRKIKNYKMRRKEDQDKTNVLNRFYPSDGNIIFHFSSSSPKRYRPAGVRAVKSWGKVFKDVFKNQPNKIIIDTNETKSVELGDLRYNIINIVDTKVASGLWGYGPSIADPSSGEIISATTNVYVAPMRESLIEAIRNYILSKLGKFDEKHLKFVASVPSATAGTHNYLIPFANALKQNSIGDDGVLSTSVNNVFKNDGFLNYIEKMSTNKIGNNRLPPFFTMSKQVADDSGDKPNLHMHDKNYGSKCGYQTANKDIIARIQKHCKSELDTYINKIPSGKYHAEGELQVLEACSEKMIEDELVATLVHELGHNLGLRHNFAASSDPNNFYYDEHKKAKVKSSSVMDYSAMYTDELLKAGKYDIAAIRFGYTNSILLDDGKSVEPLCANKSIKDCMKDKQLKALEFRFCTDQDVYDYDPLCERQDHGANPLEVVQHIIDRFHSFYAIYGHRYDRHKGPSRWRFVNSVIATTLIPLKRIHDRWRYLFTKFTGSDEKYLDSIKAQRYKALLTEMKNNEGEHGVNYRLYHDAAVKAYSFLKSLISTPPKFCITQPFDENGATAWNFEQLKKRIYYDFQLEISSCFDPIAINYFLPKDQEVVDEIGGFYNRQKASLNEAQDDYKQNLAVGLKDVRMLAMATLSIRMPLFMQHCKERFKPNFLDDLTYKKEVESFLMDRILKGIDPVSNDLLQYGIFDKIEHYRQEKYLLMNYYVMFLQGLSIPGDLEATLERWTPFFPKSSVEGGSTEGAIAHTSMAGVTFSAKEENYMVAKFIKLRNQLKREKEMADKGLAFAQFKELAAFFKKMPAISRDTMKEMTFKELIAQLELLKTKGTEVIGSLEANQKKAQYIFDQFYKQEFEILDNLGDMMDRLKESSGIEIVNEEDVFVNVRKEADFMGSKASSVLSSVFDFEEKNFILLQKESKGFRVKLFYDSLYAPALSFEENYTDFKAQFDLMDKMIMLL